MNGNPSETGRSVINSLTASLRPLDSLEDLLKVWEDLTPKRMTSLPKTSRDAVFDYAMRNWNPLIEVTSDEMAALLRGTIVQGTLKHPQWIFLELDRSQPSNSCSYLLITKTAREALKTSPKSIYRREVTIPSQDFMYVPKQILNAPLYSDKNSILKSLFLTYEDVFPIKNVTDVHPFLDACLRLELSGGYTNERFRHGINLLHLRNSFESYKPEATDEISQAILKYCEFEAATPYGRGTRRQQRSGSSSQSDDWRRSEVFHKWIQWLLRTQLEYFLINKDVAGLQAFLNAHSRAISADDMVFATALLVASQKKSVPVAAQARWLDDGDDGDRITGPGETEYLRIHKKVLSGKSRYERVYEFCEAKHTANEDWFNQILREHIPEGVYDLRHSELLGHDLQEQVLTELYSLKKLKDWRARVDECRKSFARELENHYRTLLDWPKVGEGWIGEVGLLQKVRGWFPDEKVVHQWSPDFLGRQRIDIGLPESDVAIEFHGTQHFRPVDFFGGKESFNLQVARDAKKKQLCKENGVKLLVFTEKDKDPSILAAIQKAVAQRRKRSPK